MTSFATAFYDVVPVEFKTYCSLTAEISRRTLACFGIDAKVIPCQAWYAGPNGNFVVGFFKKSSPEQWAGHAICVTGDWLIDAALHHFRKEVGIEVPDIVAKKVFGIPSNVIARFDVSAQERIWWVHAPQGVDTSIPNEPADLIERYSDALALRMRERLSARTAS